ncbi:hypothetical protein [Pectinatus haikarae]|uniref:hypothetical protein n=1 Tax=Pectinatus haikarae TaxID=349096 RepID=UPI0018C832E0|nr:hypothetical protein [Pectinatus haikarae]
MDGLIAEIIPIITDDKFIISFITSVFTFAITSGFTICRDRGKEKKDLKQNRSKLAKALYSEIKAFIDMYQEYKLTKKLPQNGDDIKIVRLECNYVVTFDNNTDKLGILDEDDIPRIIFFYMQLKSLIDTLMVLAERWEKYASYCNANAPTTQAKDITIVRILKKNIDDTHKLAFNIQEKVLKDAGEALSALEKYKQKA